MGPQKARAHSAPPTTMANQRITTAGIKSIKSVPDTSTYFSKQSTIASSSGDSATPETLFVATEDAAATSQYVTTRASHEIGEALPRGVLLAPENMLNMQDSINATTIVAINGENKKSLITVSKEDVFTYAGCFFFVVSASQGIAANTKDPKALTNNSLIISGSVFYASALTLGKLLKTKTPCVLSLATGIPLTGTLLSFLTFGILQFSQGGSSSILSGTILFSAAILSKMAYLTIKNHKDAPPANLLFALLFVHFTFAISGAMIFLYDNSDEESNNLKIQNPALTTAIGAASFLLAKLSGLHELVAGKIKSASPEEQPLLEAH